MPTVKETFDAMAGRFRAEKAAGVNATIQYDISRRSGRNLERGDQGRDLRGESGAAAAPSLTLSMSSQDWLDMVGGKLSGQMAFMSGKLKLKGDMGLAMKIGGLFQALRSRPRPQKARRRRRSTDSPAPARTLRPLPLP